MSNFITDKIGEKVRPGDDIIFSPYRSSRLRMHRVISISPAGYPQIKIHANKWNSELRKVVPYYRIHTVVNEFVKR